MSVIQLSLYIQTYVIRLLIDSNLNEDKDTYKGGEFWYIVFNGEKRRQQPMTIKMNVIDIALVSKWWLKVVRERRSMFISGHLNDAILESIQHSNRYSIFSSNSIRTLKWSLKDIINVDLSDQPKFNYETRLIPLLPQLQTINIRFDGNVNLLVLKALKSIHKHYNIQINTDFDLNGEHKEQSMIKWPNSSWEGFTPDTVSLSIRDFEPETFTHHTYHNDFIDIVRMLKPESLNLYANLEDVNQHINYSYIFKYLPSIKHINIGQDYVELNHLKDFIATATQLESLKVDIISTTCLVGTPSDSDLDSNSSIKDWVGFCDGIANHKTLKRLHLCEYSESQKRAIQSDQFTTFKLAFESIWSSGKKPTKIDYLALDELPELMTNNMWKTLYNVNCTCHNITKLLLTDGTVTFDMVSSLSRLIATTTTITVLSIRDNNLYLSTDLAEAFKKSKTITVLDVGGNFCWRNAGDDNDQRATLFNALMCSDTVQYLFLDRFLTNKIQSSNYNYFSHSKSLKEYSIIENLHDFELFFNNSLFKE
ncbi:hypothetical protein DFA_05078 [Cavenderia fasciculata]|uniref:Uncharacterized protein n=1 Tax=Cavenderia fasciculata TaxID=261658 RepID=F4PN95_CACFS|nr:uncharacterized protein DFA_05078 [Cavenderia fasciculata]EGG22948.1 hypothetical protein DFA_05078 [Cavenderia fasciculata]|eukprot:XP_004360799.1 hypothetical protein DFA_05078 [Cavenderia fasciculata]